jgi:FAD:protein FMN transferase
MTATDTAVTRIGSLTAPAWSRVEVGSAAVAAADRDALGTTARLVVWPPRNLPSLLAIVDAELAVLDQQASRFRDDSEISRLHQAGPGSHPISEGLAEVVGVALAAARWTHGLVDPTIGSALISLGYDRDFAAIEPSPSAPPPTRAGGPGWRSVRLREHALALPPGIRLDLGATAKGLGADRVARAAYATAGDGGVLVSLGGDLAVAGRPPAGGWPLLVADEHRQIRDVRNLSARAGRHRAAMHGRGHGPAVPAPGQAAAGPLSTVADPVTAQQVRLGRGGLATSSVLCRMWIRGDQVMHHIIDPRTSRPAAGPWRTVSVAAASCAEANAASTAAIIAGESAVRWLTEQGLPARLIGYDGRICRTPGWPDREGGMIDVPAFSHLPALVPEDRS